MFGSGNKDKLRENMEDIKQMVEEGETMDPSESEDGFEPAEDDLEFEDREDVSKEDIESFGQELEQEFQKQAQKEAEEKQGPEEQVEENSAPSQPQQPSTDDKEPRTSNNEQHSSEMERPEPQQDQDRPPRHEDKSGQNTSRPQQDVSRPPQNTGDRGRENKQEAGGRREAREKGREKRPNTRGLEADIPEPAETKEISVPDIDKGPLFIRREKFEQAAQLIQEMRYLSGQIESTVNTIEEDLQRDQQTERQVKELLSGFEENRAGVERIVSPKDC